MFFFPTLGAIAISADFLDEEFPDRLYTNVNCVGNETRLLDCPLTDFNSSSCIPAGVICQCKCFFCVFLFLFV